jgi:hypothetical protein
MIVVAENQGSGSTFISDPDPVKNLNLVPRLIPALKFYSRSFGDLRFLNHLELLNK